MVTSVFLTSLALRSHELVGFDGDLGEYDDVDKNNGEEDCATGNDEVPRRRNWHSVFDGKMKRRMKQERCCSKNAEIGGRVISAGGVA